MEARTVLLIILAVLIVLFVPFYPFKLIKRIILFFFNRFIPLPIKFEDIGGIPIFGMKLFRVRISLGEAGVLEAEEINLRINFWRLALLKRPSINPLVLHKPHIRVNQEKQTGEVWFLFPLTAMKWVVSTLFMNLWGLNVVKMIGGTVVIEGKKGDTVMEDFSGIFTSHGAKVKVRRLTCRVGAGSIDIHFPRRGPATEGKLVVRNIRIEDLVALKVPGNMAGPINIEAVMSGPVSDTEIVGHISSPALRMRDEPIEDFHSPLRFKGTKLSLEKMRGHMGEYQLNGDLVTDVTTDISRLHLKGKGTGKASQSILKMLAMKPFIESAGLDVDVVLEGDLNEFYEYTGDIALNLKNAKVDFSEVGQGTMDWFPLEPIPEAVLNLRLEKGVLKFIDCSAKSGKFTLHCDGQVAMHFDQEQDRVDRSQFEFHFRADSPDLQELAVLFGQGRYKVTGSVEASFNLDCDYSDHFHKLEGDGKITVLDANLTGIPILKRTMKAPKDVTVEKLEGDIILEKEQIRFENVTCVGKWLDLALGAKIGFFDKELAVDGEISVIPAIVEKNRFFKMLPGAEELSKLIRAGFRMTGKTEKPKFRFVVPNAVKEFFSPAKEEHSQSEDQG
ncbi:MAG TPA: AsmA-like C-terminal region-containing protein [bacterium]|nr:AsmA-like C-terminal region-containing protein [bacterium]